MDTDTEVDSVDSLVGDINGFLKSAAAAESNHDPYVLENALAKTLIDPTVLLEQMEDERAREVLSLQENDSASAQQGMSSAIPFLTDDQSSNSFNRDHTTNSGAGTRYNNMHRHVTTYDTPRAGIQ